MNGLSEKKLHVPETFGILQYEIFFYFLQIVIFHDVFVL